MENKLILSWDQYINDCDILTQQVKGLNFTAIIAIARGGLIPAQYIAYKANIKYVYSIGAITYAVDNSSLAEDQIDFYQTDIGTIRRLKYQNILIVDDIADSGRTLSICEKYCRKHIFGTIKIATLYYKPNKSIIKPDFYAKDINDIWVQFPYDS